MRFWKSKKNTQVEVRCTQTPIETRSASIETSGNASDISDGHSVAPSIKSPVKKDLSHLRLGLCVLADQDESDLDAVDIVALHGLNGDWERTWQHTSKSGRKVLWLRDFLPRQIPHARIMSFGYNSALQFSKSVADIGTFAEQFLAALSSLRTGSAAKRPIIFVCHSLGGIIVKKAIIRAHERDQYKTLLDSVRGIMFFGTPHRGSALASWSTLLSNIASLASLNITTNKRLSKDLENQSQALQEFSKAFVDRAKSLQLVSFYETDKMNFLNRRVVEEDSAILGLPDEVTIAINGNHRTMCQFESIDAQRYRCVWTNLQNMAGSAVKAKNRDGSLNENADSDDDTKQSDSQNLRKDHSTQKPGGSRKRGVDSLAHSDDPEEAAREARKKALQARNAYFRALANSDYEAHKNRNPTAVPGTCQWLLRHEIYCEWRRKQASNLLWLSADPGCGKSVLASYLIDNLMSEDNKLQVPEIVCYFFFKEDNNEQDNATRAICALLHQIYTAQPWLLELAPEPFLLEGSRMLRQFSTLWNLILKSLKDMRSRDILFILDGLDECEPVSRDQFLKSLVAFYDADRTNLSEAPFVKTIIASRPDNDIKAAFDMLPIIRLRGEDEPEAISNDVELVVQSCIEKAVLRGLPRSVLADLKDGLIRGADRTFLWTTMVIDLLEAKKGASKKELLEILQSRDIFRIYHRLLEGSSDQEEARRCYTLSLRLLDL